MKQKTNLDMYDLAGYPLEMLRYLRSFGFHFNKKSAKEAIKGLTRRNPQTGKEEPLTDIKDKEEIEAMLAKHNVKLENDVLYDVVWAYHMLASDFWKEAIDDEAHLAKAVKCVIDDPDQPDGFLFNRWYQDRIFAGYPIEWSDLI